MIENRITKEDLIQKILDSKKEVSMLGTLAFNLPWDKQIKDGLTLTEILYQKFINGKYRINFMTEQDSYLKKLATLAEYKSISYADLKIIRNGPNEKVRSYFVDKKCSNIEPVDDVKKKQLKEAYNEAYFKRLADEIIIHKKMDCLKNIFISLCKSLEAKLYAEGTKRLTSSKEFITFANECMRSLNLSSMTLMMETFQSELKKYIECYFENFIKDFDESAPFKGLNVCFEFSFENSGLKQVYSLSKPTLMEKFCYEIGQMCSNCFETRFSLIYKQNAQREGYAARHSMLEKFTYDPESEQRMTVKTYYLEENLSHQIIKIDDEYYLAEFLDIFSKINYIYIGNEYNSSLNTSDDIYTQNKELIISFKQKMQTKYAAEFTAAMNRNEIIYGYDEANHIIGQFPRDSFYESENVKKVIWALIFTRDGKILIHQRGINAKDNQGLWDKSVGGHISIDDKDALTGARREICEELYEIEKPEQSHDDIEEWTKENLDKIIYLGQWNDTRYPKILKGDFLNKKEVYCFSLVTESFSKSLTSTRILPNGDTLEAKCFVDLFLVLANEDFSKDNLKNSKYLLLEPNVIKNGMKAHRLSKIETGLEEDIDFDVTPDLKMIIRSDEWSNEISSFSAIIRDSFKR